MQFILHLDPQEEDEWVEVYAREERPLLQELETLTLGNRGRRYLVGLTGQGHKLIPYSQAYLFFTRAKRVWVRTPQGEYPIRERLFELEEILDARHFVRISNSEIVNISQIDSLDFSRAGSITLQLKDGHATYVSRRALTRFKKSRGNILAAATLAKASYILLGILFQLANRIYASEKVSLTLATFSHFLLALAGVATTGLVLRWFPLTPAGFAVFGLIFFLVYSLIWGISWLRTSRSVQELQEKLAQ